jgi:cell division protein FtsB
MRLRTVLSTGALVLAGGFMLFSLLGPNGIPMVLEKNRHVRALQEQNADLQRDLEQRRERIRSLSDSPSEQERQVREKLKLLKKDETTFVLQDLKK